MLPIYKSIYSYAVLIDTGAFVACLNREDSHHEVAVDCMADIINARFPVYVTQPTIFETYQRLLFDMGQSKALQFLESVLDGSLNIIEVNENDILDAQDFIRRHNDLGLSLTDAVNMSIMKRLGIGKGFSFDNHFLLTGFIRIPPLYS